MQSGFQGLYVGPVNTGVVMDPILKFVHVILAQQHGACLLHFSADGGLIWWNKITRMRDAAVVRIPLVQNAS